MARLSASSSASSTAVPPAQPNSNDAPSSGGETVRRSVPSSERKLDTDHNDRSNHDYSDVQSPFTSKPLPTDPSLLPDGKRSLSSIGLQAFSLGFAFAATSIIGTQAAYDGRPTWRLFAFLASLSLFHFLEYWTTATYNATEARASSFLLFSNGAQYNTAQGLALLEILVSTFFFPQWQARYANFITIIVGLFLVLLGQGARTLAMATAGTNFNHTPQKIKRDGHELVKTGIYAYSRHPSYFAFFWWTIGTQLLVGNKCCAVAFFAILWNFFNNRIKCKSRVLIDKSTG